jgi:(2Fe-2S) ferredoxin
LDSKPHPGLKAWCCAAKLIVYESAIAGPVLLIWPDGTWYGEVTPDRIERILTEHVIGGEPIEEWLIQRSTMDPNQAAAS